MDPIPDDLSIVDLIRNPEKVREALRFVQQMRNLEVLTTGGNIKRVHAAPKSQNAVLDLRAKQSVIPVFRALPTAPTASATLQLWLKADTLSLNDGDSISQWNDSSTYARHVTAVTASQPIFKTGVLGGKPAVLFDGINDVMVNASAGKDFSQVTVIAVVKQLGTASLQSFHSWGNAAGSNLSIGTSFHHDAQIGPLLMSINANGGNYPIGGTLPRESFRTIGFLYNGGSVNSLASYSYYDNGIPVSTTLNPTPVGGYALTGLTVGGIAGLNFFSGYVAELLVYSVALTTTEREEVEDYLFAKYGLNGVAAQDEPTEYENADEAAATEQTDGEAAVHRIITSRTGEVLVSSLYGNVLASRS